MDIIGSAVGGLLGPKPPKPQKKYHAQEAQDMLYGLMTSSLGNWGSSVPEMYLGSSPKFGGQFGKMFGGQFGGGETPPQAPMGPQPMGVGGHPAPMIYDPNSGQYKPFGGSAPLASQPQMQPSQSMQSSAAQKALEFMRTPKVRFGYGGGNFGGYTGGYGGPLQK